MKLSLAKSAGFCFGVSRAMETVESLLGRPMATLGPLIHNEQVTGRLAEQGVRIIETPDQASKDETVIIRSHGVPKATEDYLIDHNIPYIDCTCPFVKKIQNIVQRYDNEGYEIVIAGDGSHPEVIGINGWCGNHAHIIGPKDTFEGLSFGEKPVCAVAQTTINRDFWKNIKEFLKNTCQNPLIFDTICNATNERQAEALALARQADCCIVIGGRHSSNTCKLYDICRAEGPAYQVEQADELSEALQYIRSNPVSLIGITAGASTPDWIIKEVLRTMEKNLTTEDAAFAEAFEKSFITLNTGDVVTGTVIAVTPTEVFVNLGYKSDGVIPAGELTDDPNLKPEDLVKVGDEIEVFVVRVSDVEGTVKLSKKKVDSMKGWAKMEEAMEAHTVLDGKVVEVVNGGVIALVNGVRVFVPASKANDRYLSDLSVLVGEDVKLQIINIDQRRRKIVGDVKSLLVAEKTKKQEAFWADMEIGKQYSGVVKTLTPFGAFVDIGGVDGLIHISQLSWGRIKHPSEVVKEGDVVEVTILDANRETNKISLGYRKTEDNPYVIAQSKFHVDDVVTVKVVKLMPFGAFVELMPGVDGLIHISQIANKRIDKPADELSVGQEVEAKIIELDWETKKVGLSIRALIQPEEVAAPVVEEEAPAEEVVEETVAAYTEDAPATLADAMGDIQVEE